MAFFKQGIKPEWEDPANKGKFEYRFELLNADPDEMDSFWKTMVFDIMGGKEEFVTHVISHFSNYT